MNNKHKSNEPVGPQAILLEAVGSGNISLASDALDAGADLALVDAHGFNPLQQLVTNESLTANRTCQLIELFIDHGADLNAKSKDGRSVIFLAAEFQTRKAPVELLLNAGADPNVMDSYGTHITENARAKVVRKLLSSATGNPLPRSTPLTSKERALSSTQWSSGRKRISKAFRRLDSENILCLHQAGRSQDEGMDACSEEIQKLGGIEKSKINGCCFYTWQDFQRCKAHGYLHLAFWSAHSGDEKDMLKIGRLIVDAFCESGFDVEWDNTADNRPKIWI